ncbi:hypothetical protein ACFUMH_07475 [Cellulomonas sp. NPDC057328]|uniref:hypothetical protein n=1 Tax=Cellulomonas sp. NPDC057328 TaxID=3346101 RepID=UPI0036273555
MRERLPAAACTATRRARVGSEYASAGVRANGLVGGYAEAGVGIGKDGVDAKAGGFLGLQAGAQLDANVGGIGAEVAAEGWAGAGAEAGLTAGKNEDGSWTVRSNAGGALGLGGSVSSAVTVAADQVQEVIEAATGWLMIHAVTGY